MKLVAAIAVALAAGTATAATDPGRHAMKGWELYTWFDRSCAPDHDAWCAALVPGTNRAKSADEIKRARVRWRDLPGALAGLARGEDVAWVRAPRVFDLPGAPLRDRIVALAKQDGLTLAVVDRR